MKNTLTRLALLVGVLSLVVTSSCKKKKVTVNMSANFTDIDFDIPPCPAGTYIWANIVMPNDLDSVLNANGATFDDVKSVSLQSASLVIRNITPGAYTFDYLDQVGVHMLSASSADVIVAESNPVPHVGAVEAALTSKGVALANYAKESGWAVFASGTTNQPIADTLKMRLKLYFDVAAEVEQK